MAVQQLILTFDLSQSLGIFFDEEKLVVEECADGAQAKVLGVPPGATVTKLGDAAVNTPEELIEHIQSLKESGTTSVDIVFNLPIAAQPDAGDSTAEAPAAGDNGEGESSVPPAADMAAEEASDSTLLKFDLSQSLGIFFDEESLLVEECAEGSQAESLGVPVGATAVSIGGRAVNTPEELVEHIQSLKANGDTSVDILFKHPDQSAQASEGADAAEQAPQSMEAQSTLTFDLSQSLGIFFDEESLLVEECAEGSQAETLGVPVGGMAVSIGGKAVSTPEELIEHIQSLKASGTASVDIVFNLPDAAPQSGDSFTAAEATQSAEDGGSLAAAAAEPPPKPLVEQAPGTFSPLEDDGTLMLIGIVPTHHPKMQRLLNLTEEQLPKANGVLQKVHKLLVECSTATAMTAAIGKAASDAQRELRRINDMLQQAVEAVDSIDLAAASAAKMARRDLIKFVQLVQDRLEVGLKSIAPVLPTQQSNGTAASAETKDPLPAGKAAIPAKKEEPKPIVVRYQGRGANPPPSDNLYIKALPGGTTEADVKAIFDGIGDVQSMKVLSDESAAVAFVRLGNRKQAKIAIDKLNDTVPRRLLEKAGLVPSAEQMAALQPLKGAALLARGIPLRINLSSSLGCEIDDEMNVEEVEEGSQAANLRVPEGARVKAIEGLSIKSTAELVAKIQELKGQGATETTITFDAPQTVAVFEDRPFGLSLDYEHSVGLFLVDDAEGLALSKAVQVGYALIAVNGQPTEGISLSRLFDTLKSVPLPAALTFCKMPSIDAIPQPSENGWPGEPRKNTRDEGSDSESSMGGKSVDGAATNGQARGRGKGRKGGGKGRGKGEGAGGENSTAVSGASLDDIEADVPPAKRQKKKRWD
mmetsp:Transcript_10734/g.24481  ORF Transcript_10734/g.24481 Transcript_10734/m.24481 type:complete len:871 (-) Transcript_10734:101-2713(-)